MASNAERAREVREQPRGQGRPWRPAPYDTPCWFCGHAVEKGKGEAVLVATQAGKFGDAHRSCLVRGRKGFA